MVVDDEQFLLMTRKVLAEAVRKMKRMQTRQGQRRLRKAKVVAGPAVVVAAVGMNFAGVQ